LWFVGGFVIVDFLSFPLMDYGVQHVRPAELLLGLFCAVMTGQLGLLAVWAVFGPGPVQVRQLWTLAVTGFLLASFFAGSGFGVGPKVDEMATAFLCLPLALLATQLPLWIVKLMTGRRLVRVQAETAQSPIGERQFGVGHLMATTVVVAAALGLASSNQRLFEIEQDEFWIQLGAFCLFSCLSSLLATLPCLWAGLGAKNLRAGAVGLAVYAVVMICLSMGLLHLFAGGPSPFDSGVMLLSFVGSSLLVTFGTFCVVRSCGYRFQRGRRPRPVVAGGGPCRAGGETSAETQAAKRPAEKTPTDGGDCV
jgi:hypothetical protein